MPVTRLVSINANGGSWTPIVATMAAHEVQIVEDGSVTAQGIAAQFKSDGFGTTDTYPPGQVIQLVGHGNDGAAGLPAQNAPGGFNYRAGDTYCQLRSATASGTVVRVVESET